MQVNIPTKTANKGSCATYINYLEKENENKPESEKERFFSAEKDGILKREVIKGIDEHKHKLNKKEPKFFSINLSPSQAELKHIGSDKEKLKEFTRSAMDEYAANFKRDGLNDGKDLVYYAKIEQERKHKGYDKEVKQGLAKQGEKKKGTEEGLQTHIHVIVARMDKPKYKSLSPLVEARPTKTAKLNGKDVAKGFDREEFFRKVENSFDKVVEYPRKLEETYDFKNDKKKLSIAEKIEQRNAKSEEKAKEFDKEIAEIHNPKEKGQEVGASLDQKVEQENPQQKEVQQQEEKEKKRDRGQSLDFPSM